MEKLVMRDGRVIDLRSVITQIKQIKTVRGVHDEGATISPVVAEKDYFNNQMSEIRPLTLHESMLDSPAESTL